MALKSELLQHSLISCFFFFFFLLRVKKIFSGKRTNRSRLLGKDYYKGGSVQNTEFPFFVFLAHAFHKHPWCLFSRQPGQ